MNFRDEAAPALTAVAERAAVRATEAVCAEVQKFQTALADACGKFQAALESAVAADLEDIEASVETLTSTADAFAALKSEEAANEVRVTLAATQSEVDELAREKDALTAALEAGRADVDGMRTALEAERAGALAMREECTEAQEQAQRVEILLEAASAQLATLQREHTELLGECHDLRSELDGALAGAVTVRERAETAERACERLRADAARAARTAPQAIPFDRHGENTQIAMAFLAASFDRLLAVFHALERSTTVDEVVDVIMAAMGQEFSRVAILRRTPERLEGLRQEGFTPALDMTKVVLPRVIAVLLEQAVTSGRIETLEPDDLATLRDGAFAGAVDLALAFSLSLDGVNAVIVYADDVNPQRRERVNRALQMQFLEILRRQTAPFARRAGTPLGAEELESYAPGVPTPVAVARS
jgi:hypothetical protein